ncbi:hypothetical protein IRY61_06505 [Candidatus Saccharibacteria bacterium]|nr:hypothetical protein [Candidatus Saccharibacteria bacterium]
MTLLLKIRLRWFFFILLAAFFGLAYAVPVTEQFNPSLATLLVIAALMYGFFITPILTAQKRRIEALSKIIRAEANAIFGILVATRKLPEQSRNLIQDMCADYLTASFRQRRPAEGEHEYERLISYCLDYSGKDPDTIDKILEKLVANQRNRSRLAMQLNNRVYANEWWILLVLFSVVISLIMALNVPGDLIGQLIKALLCTGVSMLMINLLKLSTLTHRKAKDIWQPLNTLKTSRFRRFD